MGILDILNEKKEAAAPPSSDQAKSLQFLSAHTGKIESIKQLVGQPPAPGCAWFLWTLNSFNAFTFIPYLLKEHGVIERLTITTYTINRRISDALFRLMDTGKVHHLTLFISESLKFRMPKVVDHLEVLHRQKPEMLQIIYAWNHSKIALAQCGQQHYVIEGSGNWSENARHEQYVFLNSAEVYQFRLDAITASLCTPPEGSPPQSPLPKSTDHE
jgi:hypothetical protein